MLVVSIDPAMTDMSLANQNAICVTDRSVVAREVQRGVTVGGRQLEIATARDAT